MKSRVLAMTMGDPGGIGPEIILKSLRRFPKHNQFYLVLIGSYSVFELASKLLEIPFKPHLIKHIDPKLMKKNTINFLDISREAQKLSRKADGKFQIGKISLLNGALAFASLKVAAREAARGKIQGIVTAPLNKQTMRLVKPGFRGHTEYLAQTAGKAKFAMFFYSPYFCVTLATIHHALKDVSKKIKSEDLITKIKLTHEFLRTKLKLRKPRIALACLNPHGDEFGQEEAKIIRPAAEKARESGILVDGPLPGDQVFHDAYAKKYHAVIAMYHDQGLAPFKMIAFDEGVNVTLGLPYIRTSPDHGTAFDIAYKNKANPTSFLESLRLAGRIVSR